MSQQNHVLEIPEHYNGLFVPTVLIFIFGDIWAYILRYLFVKGFTVGLIDTD